MMRTMRSTATPTLLVFVLLAACGTILPLVSSFSVLPTRVAVTWKDTQHQHQQQQHRCITTASTTQLFLADTPSPSAGNNEGEKDDVTSSSSEEDEPATVETPTTPEQEPESSSSPPPVKTEMDPLLMALTRDDKVKSGETVNIPLLGEFPVDGGVVVLVPTLLIAVLGFIFSAVVAFNARDELVVAMSQIGDEMAAAANAKVNSVPQEGVCRGLCSSQETDLMAMKDFMESLRK